MTTGGKIGRREKTTYHSLDSRLETKIERWKHFLFGDYFINSHNLFLLKMCWYWLEKILYLSLLGLKGWRQITSVVGISSQWLRLEQGGRNSYPGQGNIATWTNAVLRPPLSALMINRQAPLLLVESTNREAISSLSAVSKAAHSCTLNVLSLLGEFSCKKCEPSIFSNWSPSPWTSR